MEQMPILGDLVLIIASAIAVILVSNRFRVPAIVGLLLTGLLIGPYALGVVRRVEPVQVLAEVGVVALLFTIGLEFSLDRLRHIRRAFLVGGSLQAIGTLLVVAPIMVAVGESVRRAIFFAFLAILSSTAIVLKLYADRKELETPHGRLVIGIVLFQDFLIVPMIILVPVLAGVVEASAVSIATRFGGGLLLIAAVVVVARFVMPKLLYQLVRTRSSEVLILGSLFVALGMSLFTEKLGFSMALGAFLAGIIISESEYSHQVIADVIPFKDVFNSLFFISIGMLLDLRFVATHLGAVVGLGLAIIVVKAIVVFAVVKAMMFPLRTATFVSLALAQVGEFSFVLANSGAEAGLFRGGAYPFFIGSSIVTMLLTPLLVALAPRLVEVVTSGETAVGTSTGVSGHVIIVGFGVNGKNLARVLKEVGIRYTVIDLDGENVRGARAAGEPIAFGDATRREILLESGIDRAHTIVFGISDLQAVQKAVRFARQLNPKIRILVRTRQVAEIEELYRCGADDVVAEEFETSIEIFTRVLEGYHVPTNVIGAQIRVLRGGRYQLLRLPAGTAGVSDQILDVLAAGTTDVFGVAEGMWAVGKSLRDVNLSEATGATVIAIVRGDTPHPSPSPDFTLQRGDFVVLIGNHASIDEAFKRLERGPRQA